MFTGIVQGTSVVRVVTVRPGLHTLHLSLPEGSRKGIAKGASVCVDGVCLTVAGDAGGVLQFDVMEETLRATTLGALRVGSAVNVERSARAGDEIGGHMVSGHVDTQAELIEIREPENNRILVFRMAPEWMKYVFSKGFLSINGCSLTVVNACRAAGTFEVWLIPETLSVTTFPEKKTGDRVNIEIDRQTQAIVDTVSELLKDREWLKGVASG